jgi:glycosyltransferase involved in cell wall biosynthesis
MTSIISLDKNHSTTRLVTKEKPEILYNSSYKFKRFLFFPTSEGRRIEGGLRTKGYFKRSYNGKALISIITVVLNGEDHLEETILSVINQTYDNVEYIIIDGGSTDGTLDIIKRYTDKIDYWISEKDRGIYDAWNKAIQISCGQWIGFLGSDDFYELNAVQIYVESINLYSEVEFISSQSYFCTKDKKIIRKVGKAWNWKDFSIYMNTAHVGSLHHMSLFENYGIYDINFRVCGDYELLLRAGNKLKAGFVNQTLCNTRIGGISHGGTSEIFEEIYQAKFINNTRPTSLHIYIDTLWARLKWIISKYYYNKKTLFIKFYIFIIKNIILAITKK